MTVRPAVFLSIVACVRGYTLNVPNLGSLNGGGDGTPARYENVAVFLGIPYAKPPIGDLRWQPPQPYGPWQSPRDATKFGQACIQPPGLAAGPFSEDCLTLNVATPQTQLTAQEKLPVMFWIYGGSYTQGAAASYPIDALVAQSGHKVVVAAANYRLGYLGFAASAEIQARSHDGSAGNFGIQDQRLGMKWVQDHIAAFGGDGKRMTIFGESAGGSSVMNHLAAPRSGGLFQRAIIQSGTYMSGAQPFDHAQQDFGRLLKRTGCENLACLVEMKNTTVLECHDLEYWPAIDGVEFEASAGQLIQSGTYHKDVDVLLGSNRDEFALFSQIVPLHKYAKFSIDALLQPLAYDALLEFAVPDPFLHSAINSLYDPNGDYEYPVNLANYSIYWWKITRILTDGGGLGVFTKGDKGAYALGHCGARNLARSLKSGGTSKVFQYLFAGGQNLVGHGSEIGYAFGDVIDFSSEGDKQLATAMAKYWSNFAVTGNPNGDELQAWPEYDADTDKSLRLDQIIAVQDKFRSGACDFWDKHNIRRDPNEEWFTPGPKVSAASVIV